MAGESPFDLVLSVVEGPGLRAVIRNRSQKEQVLCHDIFWQSVNLVLEGTKGQEVRRDDERTRMKPLSPIDNSAFITLKPGETYEPFNASFRKNHNNECQFEWGYTNFYLSQPGKYAAKASLESIRDSWAEGKGGPWHTVKNVWKGVLESNRVEFNLP